MSYYGYVGSPASRVELRFTRDGAGNLTDTKYRLRTMLTEDGGIYLLGEQDVQTASGLFRKTADQTVPVSELHHRERMGEPYDRAIGPYLARLDALVEAATPEPKVVM